MVEIRPIIASAAIPEAWSLLEEHRLELTTNKGLMVLAPDVETYQRLEAEGRMISIGAFKDGAIIGYSINILARNLHYSALLMCQNDLLFVAAAHRRGPVGIRLIQATERAARAAGARLMLWHAKPGTTLDQIMPRMGARVQDIIYSKEL